MSTSYSKLTLFDTCPHAYDLQVNKGHKGMPSFPMVSGQKAHEVLQHYGQHCLKHKTTSDYEHFDDLLKEVDESEDADIAFDIRMALKKVREYLRITPTSKFELEFAVDKDFNLIPFDAPAKDLYFRGIIDQADFVTSKEASITDYKTGWKTKASPFQLRVYALMLMVLMPKIESTSTKWLFTRYAKTEDGPEVERKDVDALKALLVSRITKIRTATEFPANITPENCKNCSVYNFCEPFKKFREEKKDHDYITDPAGWYNYIQLMKDYIKNEEKRLHTMVEAMGMLKIGDKRYTKKITDSLVLGKGVTTSSMLGMFTAEEAKAAGLTLTSAMNEIKLSATQVRDLLGYAEKSPALRSKLEPMLRVSKRSAWKLIGDGKVDEEDEE